MCHAPASRPSDRIAPAPRPASVAFACEKTDTYGAEAMRWRTVSWALGNGELRLIPNPRKCSSTQYLMTRQRSSSSEKICRRRTMARLPLGLVAVGGGEFSWKAPHCATSVCACGWERLKRHSTQDFRLLQHSGCQTTNMHRQIFSLECLFSLKHKKPEPTCTGLLT
jgi:hypothetical protein